MENNLGREYSSIAITPDLSPENISSYINNLELIRSNSHKVDFLIIRNKSLDRDGYQKLAERIMKSLNGKIPCILHFDNLDSFLGMSDLISESSREFGNQCIVIAIDARRKVNKVNEWEVYVKGGRENTGIDVLSWAKKVEELGAGEILLTSMDGDGTQNGYDLNLTESVANIVDIPVIASGGAGSLEDIYDVFKEGRASAALLASLLHDKKLTLKEIKTFLLEKNLPIRPFE